MTSHGMRRLVVSVLSAGVVALAATTAGAQQGPAGPQGGQQATQGGGITFQTTPAEIGQRFPAGGAPFASAVRAFLDANASDLKKALDFVGSLVPNLNAPQTDALGEVLGNLATAFASRGDTASLLAVQQMVAGQQGNSFLMAGYYRSTGLNPQTAGLGGGVGGGGGAGGTGGISGGAGNTGTPTGGGNTTTNTTTANPISGGSSSASQGPGNSSVVLPVSPSSL